MRSGSARARGQQLANSLLADHKNSLDSLVAISLVIEWVRLETMAAVWSIGACQKCWSGGDTASLRHVSLARKCRQASANRHPKSLLISLMTLEQISLVCIRQSLLAATCRNSQLAGERTRAKELAGKVEAHQTNWRVDINCHSREIQTNSAICYERAGE